MTTASETPPKWLQTPPSTNTVRVRMIDTTSKMLLNSKSFVKPVLPGRDKMFMKDAAFLVENDRCGKKALFDLGVRKDFWNLSPVLHRRIDKIASGLSVDEDVADILIENEFELGEINDIIWSHSHWDHTGDPSRFPSSTNLVAGPGLKDHLPGYPENPSSPQLATNFANRSLKEIEFDEEGLRIGGFSAHDFYGDGSFYLLETPGHAKGHLCGLARVTSGSDTSNTTTTNSDHPSSSPARSTFILLGGDVFHFCGSIRPSPSNPLPRRYHEMLQEHPQFPPQTSPSTAASNVDKPEGMDSVVALNSRPKAERDSESTDEIKSRTPWFTVSTDESTAYDFPGPEIAQETFDKLRTHFDEAANVLVAIAHDASLLNNPVIPRLNSSYQNKRDSRKEARNSGPSVTKAEPDLNDWYAQGWKEQIMWGWIDDLDSGNPDANQDLVSGFWKDGVQYRTLQDLVAQLF